MLVDIIKIINNMPIEELEIKNMWTPITEGKPEDGQAVFITAEFHGEEYTQEAVYVEDLVEYNKYEFLEHRPGFAGFDSEVGYFEIRNVLAWMPMIEPWKGEKDD